MGKVPCSRKSLQALVLGKTAYPFYTRRIYIKYFISMSDPQRFIYLTQCLGHLIQIPSLWGLWVSLDSCPELCWPDEAVQVPASTPVTGQDKNPTRVNPFQLEGGKFRLLHFYCSANSIHQDEPWKAKGREGAYSRSRKLKPGPRQS